MPKNEWNTRDVTRITLAVLFIGILIASSFWILRPFITAIIWAMIIVVATWPVMLKMQAGLRNKRGLAVAVMTVILLLVIIVPLFFAIVTIMDNAENVAARIKSLGAIGLPLPPEWVGKIPVLGPRIADQWHRIAAIPPEELPAQVAPYARDIGAWFLSKAGNIGMKVVQFLLTVIISAIMYAGGETAAAGIRGFARRLAGPQGEEVTILAAKAIKGVAIGIVGTALIQTAIGGAGLFVSGVPAAPLLTAVIFMLCLAQLGPILVMVPAVIWLYWKGDPLWGTVLLVFTIVAGGIDNFIRPLLIKKGADLPLIMIFAGVIGGLIAFGVVGLFIGPVVLSVTYTLLKAWVSDSGQEQSGQQN
ncbi:MAG: AI-2E family transporter YdiK [Nitrospirae bacterium]|nr:AI-2E family transporter YdiK [Nitrospirota bacterium]